MNKNKKTVMMDFMTLDREAVKKKYKLTDKYYEACLVNHRHEYNRIVTEERVLKAYNKNKNISLSKLSELLNLPRGTVTTILINNGQNIF